MSKWCLREAIPEDMNLVTDSWLESFRKSHAAGPIPSDMYRPLYRKVIQRVLERPGVKVLVAFNPEDEHQIFGWACTEPGVLHFVFTKATFRQWGIARNLVEASGLDLKARPVVTFKTPAVTDKLKSWGLRFDPLLIRKTSKREDS